MADEQQDEPEKPLTEREIVRQYLERSQNFQRSQLARWEERCRSRMAEVRASLVNPFERGSTSSRDFRIR
jgi:hypothetical protein